MSCNFETHNKGGRGLGLERIEVVVVVVVVKVVVDVVEEIVDVDDSLGDESEKDKDVDVDVDVNVEASKLGSGIELLDVGVEKGGEIWGDLANAKKSLRE